MKEKRKGREGKRNKKGDRKRVRQHERVSRLEDDNAKRKQEEVGDGEKGGVEGERVRVVAERPLEMQIFRAMQVRGRDRAEDAAAAGKLDRDR